ncbi:DNA excision repair protein ERCC-6 [Ixodes scapularis]
MDFEGTSQADLDSPSLDAELGTEHHGSTHFLPSFLDGASEVQNIPESDQADELRGLGISVYDQVDLERGIMGAVDRMVQQKEKEQQQKAAEKELAAVRKEIGLLRQKMARIERTTSLYKLASTGFVSPAIFTMRRDKEEKMEELKKLQSREAALVAAASGVPGDESALSSNTDDLDEDDKLRLERMFGRKETEEERLIRTGQMTPFGTLVQNQEQVTAPDKLAPIKLRRITDGSSSASRWQTTEQDLTDDDNEQTLSWKPSMQDVSSASTSGQTTSRHAADDSSRGGSTSARELVSQVPSPRKRKKKVKLGTVTRRRPTWRARGRDDSLLGEEFLLDPEMSDFENDDDDDAELGKSDEEYRPDADDCFESDEDADSAFLPKAVPERKSKSMLSTPKKQKLDSSENGDLKKPPPQKRFKKLLDDGNYASYVKRIKEHRHAKLVKKHQKILDGGDGESGSDSAVEVDDELRVPAEIWNKLYRYQQTGVRWLWELHRQNTGGIVGDEMGLGKTIQTIAFFAGLHHSNLRTLGDSFQGLGPVVLICPTTVMHQWVREFHRWYPPVRVAILHDSGSFAGSKETLVRQVNRDRGVLVTSYAGVSKLSPMLLRHEWHYVVLDEGHKIRNPDAQTTLACKQFRTTHRIILSGSPIQNNLRELWSLFDFVFPGKLGTLPVFMQEFAVPITQGGYSNATDVQVQTAYKCASVLRDTIKPYLLRRMKDDVQCNLQLPKKNEQVLFCRLTDHQRDLYRQYLDTPEIASILVGRLQVFVGLINLRKICNHPDLFDGGPKVFKDTDLSTLPAEMRYGFPGRSGKMAVVESLLKLWKRQGHRVLLFTQSRQMLLILEKFVQDQGYKYMVMTGSTPIASRQPAINKFNVDTSVFVFLLTTRVGGLGVNLTGADRVVIYDPDWNPSTDTQARERAWRIGQLRDVTIYRLLTAGTIEEKIYHRQIFKQFLTNRVLKDPKQRRFFKTNDLHELFCLADDAKQKRTETSAIFAGTGSDVKPKAKESRTKNPETEDARTKGPATKTIPTKSSRPKNSQVKHCPSEGAPRKFDVTKHQLSKYSAAEMNPTKDNVTKESSETKSIATKVDAEQNVETKYALADCIPVKDVLAEGASTNDVSTPGSVVQDVLTRDTSMNGIQTKESSTKGAATKGDPTTGDAMKDNVTKEDVMKDDITKDVVTKDVSLKDVRTKDAAENDDSTKEDVTKRDATKDHEVKDEVTPKPLLSSEKIDQMRELARRLSQKIGTQAAKTKTSPPSKPVEASSRKRTGNVKPEKTRSKHKSKRAVVEGEHIGFVVKQTTYQPEADDAPAGSEHTQKQDDYVLQKLFKKSGVHSAMRHDTIMDSADPDYVLVEGEAERVAKEAIRKLRQSRRHCLGASSGVPTWTGANGTSGAPPGTKPRFGQKKVSRVTPGSTNPPEASKPPAAPSPLKKDPLGQPGIFTHDLARTATSAAPDVPESSSELLARIRARNHHLSDGAEPSPSSADYLDSGSGEYDDLLADLQTFVAFGASVDGQATTEEVLAAFKDKVRTRGSAPVFKALLGRICEFYRRDGGQGVWRLKPEFR